MLVVCALGGNAILPRGAPPAVDTEREQMMPALRIQQPPVVATGHEAAGLHVETTAGLQRPAAKGFFEFCGRHGPVFGQAVENQVLEQHGSRIHGWGRASIAG